MSNDAKELGSKQMFEQSLIYLFNSYRENGLSKEEASKNVLAHIEEVYERYAAMGVAQESRNVLANPKSRIENIIIMTKGFDWADWRSLSPKEKESKVRALHQSIVVKLNQVNQLL